MGEGSAAHTLELLTAAPVSALGPKHANSRMHRPPVHLCRKVSNASSGKKNAECVLKNARTSHPQFSVASDDGKFRDWAEFSVTVPADFPRHQLPNRPATTRWPTRSR